MYKIALFSFFFFSVTNLLAQTRRYYVDPAAFGQNSGQTWYDAFTNLHDALAIAVKGDEIWVAQGIYRPTDGNDRNAHYELLSGVRLLGGFAGTEMDVSERDIEAHPSILDGDIGMPGDSTDNTYNLLYMYRPDIETVLDGFVFQNALADKPGITNGFPGVSGAAIYVMATDGTAYPTIANCNFFHNIALKDGGAIYVNGSGEGSVAPFFDHCKFFLNKSVLGYGGALCRNGGSKFERPADLGFCEFVKNSSYRRGGAIYFIDSPGIDTFDIVNCKIQENSNGVPPGESLNGLDIGSVLYWEYPRFNGGTFISFSGSTFTGNDHVLFGTQLAFFEVGNAYFNLDSCLFLKNNNTYLLSGEILRDFKFNIFNSRFVDCTIGLGLNCDFSIKGSNTIMNSTFSNCNFRSLAGTGDEFKIINTEFNNNGKNSVDFSANRLVGNKIKLENCILENNGFINPNTSKFELSGISISASKSTIINCSFHNNLFSEEYNTPSLTENCIFYLKDTALLMNYILLFNKNENVNFIKNIINVPILGPLKIQKDSLNLWSTDPMFVSPDSGDFHLQACSPAINAGLNDGN
ncbi:MAG: hypothetical protein KGS48_08930, partial [Bacteroidetes bacterium]|nr:hypothetical protein [Bacteroidota bacterium]